LSVKLIEKINKLKTERNAVILAHNYQPGEIQDIADYTGDSLGLSVRAASTDAETIVFCGVLFMAETAAILSPEKTVLLPEIHAGCPMADMITAEQLKELKARHPEALAVCYVNTPAEVKAECDYCCTSGNAVELINSLPPSKQIIFVPDKYLGRFVAEKTGRNIILWPGYCPTHARITAEQIEKLKAENPDAISLAHPECNEQVAHVADEMLSTGQMLKFVKQSDAKKFIIATELGIIHTLKNENPDKEFIPVAANIICPNMKKTTLEKVLWALEENKNVITVSKEIAIKAKASLDKMLQVLPK
jgi:quinolinate synthase